MTDESSGFNINPTTSPGLTTSSPRLIHESRRGYCRVINVIRDGRRIALKMLKKEYVDSQIHRELLRKEYDIGHTLYHPNIVSIISYETIENEGPAIVMEYIDGVTLSDYLRSKGGTIPESEACDILQQLCDALNYIHSHQLIHRDIKPDNIMLTNSGRFVKIIDFGLSDGASFTRFKNAGGTLHYSAPEQLSQGIDNDPRADIYSLGVIMKQLVREPSSGYKKYARQCGSDNIDNRPDTAKKIISSINRYNQRRRIALLTVVSILIATGLIVGTSILLHKPYAPTGTQSEMSDIYIRDTLISIQKVHDTVYIEQPTMSAIAERINQPTDDPYSPELSRGQIDSILSYTRSYTLSQLEHWNATDTLRFRLFDHTKIVEYLDNYCRQQSGGDQSTYDRLRPLMTEAYTSVTRGFFRKNREKLKK